MNKDIIIGKLINDIREKFPEISIRLENYIHTMGFDPEDKIHTCLLEEFSQATTDAIRNNDEDAAKKYLDYMSNRLSTPDETEKEFIDTYYVEPLMWNDYDGERQKRCWQLMPKNLQELYYNFWGRKTYYEK